MVNWLHCFEPETKQLTTTTAGACVSRGCPASWQPERAGEWQGDIISKGTSARTHSFNWIPRPVPVISWQPKLWAHWVKPEPLWSNHFSKIPLLNIAGLETSTHKPLGITSDSKYKSTDEFWPKKKSESQWTYADMLCWGQSVQKKLYDVCGEVLWSVKLREHGIWPSTSLWPGFINCVLWLHQVSQIKSPLSLLKPQRKWESRVFSEGELEPIVYTEEG